MDGGVNPTIRGTCGDDDVVVVTAGAELVPYAGLYAGAEAGFANTRVGKWIAGTGFFGASVLKCEMKSIRFGFAYLMKAGYDFRLSDRWAIGPYAYFFGGPTIPGVDRTTASWNVLSIGVMGVFKLGSRSTEERLWR